MQLQTRLWTSTWTEMDVSGFFVQAHLGGVEFREPNMPYGPLVLDEYGEVELITYQLFATEEDILTTELGQGQLAVASDTYTLFSGNGTVPPQPLNRLRVEMRIVEESGIAEFTPEDNGKYIILTTVELIDTFTIEGLDNPSWPIGAEIVCCTLVEDVTIDLQAVAIVVPPQGYVAKVIGKYRPFTLKKIDSIYWLISGYLELE